MGTTLGYLTSLYGTANSSMGSGSLLATLYGHAGQSPNSLGQNPVTALKSAEQRQTQDIKAIAAQPAVNRAVNAFIAAVNSAKTVRFILPFMARSAYTRSPASCRSAVIQSTSSQTVCRLVSIRPPLRSASSSVSYTPSSVASLYNCSTSSYSSLQFLFIHMLSSPPPSLISPSISFFFPISSFFTISPFISTFFYYIFIAAISLDFSSVSC